MKPGYLKFRILLFTLALGLASVRFFIFLYEEWTVVRVDLPQVQSETPIFVYARNPAFYHKITDEELIQDRDLSLYDLYCLSWRERSQVRKLIFKYWEAKKQAYINYVNCAGDSCSEIHIFIEPDNNGKWLIVLRYTGDLRYPFLEEERGFSLKFKRATEDEYPLGKGQFFLSVLDKNGKEIAGF
jgi:hypothetical protein